MRILIEFVSKGNYMYENDNYHIQGFLYSLLKGTDFEYLHDKKGSKFFCFSNIFPISNFKFNEKKFLIVSSPIKDLIKTLFERVSSKIGEKIFLGKKILQISNCKVFDLKLRFPWETATPIVLRKEWEIFIHSNGKTFRILTENVNLKKRLEKHKERVCCNFSNVINLDEKEIDKLKDFKVVKIRDIYFSFNKGHGLYEWLEKLKENSIQKFKEFYNEDLNLNTPIFDMISFRKEISVKIQIKGKEAIFIGTMWRNLNVLRNLDKKQKKFYKFLLDTGLGVLNSLGFGFVNISSNSNINSLVSI